MQQAAVSALLLLICVVVVCHIPDSREGREKVLDKKQMCLLSAISQEAQYPFPLFLILLLPFAACNSAGLISEKIW